MKKTKTSIKSGKTTESLITKLLQDKLRPRLKETIDRISKDDYSSPPFAALVDLTNNCNLNCPWCIDKYARFGKEIPTQRMLDLLDEFKKMGVLSIVYFGGGEPLIHPGIDKILKKTSKLGIDYAVNTNGIALGEVIDTIAKSSSWTRISWDAGSSKTYEKMHRKDFFDQIKINTRKLTKKARGTVGISFVVMEDNIADISQAAKIAKEVGCDFIQFKPEYTPFKSNKRIIGSYNNSLSSKIKKELCLAQQEETNAFSVLITGSLKAILDKKVLNQNKRYSYCAAQQFIPLLTPHGVYICPNWRGAKKKQIGNILKSSLEEIWKSNKRKQVIKSLNCGKECQLFCLRHDFNVLIDVALRAKSMDLEIMDALKEYPGEEISDHYFI